MALNTRSVYYSRMVPNLHISFKPLHTGAIAGGGIIGGVLGLLILLALAFFLRSAPRRRRQQKQNRDSSRSDIPPFVSNDEKPSPPDIHLTLSQPW